MIKRTATGLAAIIFGSLSAIWSGALVACSAPDSGTPPGQIVVPKHALGGTDKSGYFVELLDRVLARTAEEYGPCAIVSIDQHTTRMRSTVLISSKQGIDLFWATTSLDREEALRPIRIPLLKGLMSHRVLLIQADDQEAFSQVKNLEDLQKLRAGQGTDWPDVSILRSNGIEVVTSSYYNALPRMLTAGRFDFFPRSAAEVLTELAQMKDLPIVLEKELVVIYPTAIYYFVNRDNEVLAKRIETGLNMMIEDGSFDEFFSTHPMIVEALETLKLNQRRAIYLDNLFLPPTVPLDVDRYWLFHPGKPPKENVPVVTEPDTGASPVPEAP